MKWNQGWNRGWTNEGNKWAFLFTPQVPPKNNTEQVQDTRLFHTDYYKNWLKLTSKENLYRRTIAFP